MAKIGWFDTKKSKKGRKTNEETKMREQPLSNFVAPISFS